MPPTVNALVKNMAQFVWKKCSANLIRDHIRFDMVTVLIGGLDQRKCPLDCEIGLSVSCNCTFGLMIYLWFTFLIDKYVREQNIILIWSNRAIQCFIQLQRRYAMLNKIKWVYSQCKSIFDIFVFGINNFNVHASWYSNNGVDLISSVLFNFTQCKAVIK